MRSLGQTWPLEQDTEMERVEKFLVKLGHGDKRERWRGLDEKFRSNLALGQKRGRKRVG